MSDMNRQLLEVYSRVLDHDIWSRLANEPELSGPLLIEVPDAFHNARVKLMIVGQQTKGWEHTKAGIEGLLAYYRRFELGKRKRSPFWRAARSIYNCLNPAGPPQGFIWSNLIKVDVNEQRPHPELEELICCTDLLQYELAITQPDVVVFFTGPSYDERLRITFPGVVCERVNDFVNRLSHGALPGKAFQSYHPGYLQRSKHWHVIDELKTLAGC